MTNPIKDHKRKVVRFADDVDSDQELSHIYGLAGVAGG